MRKAEVPIVLLFEVWVTIPVKIRENVDTENPYFKITQALFS